MDPEQAREELRTVLRTFGAEVTLFKDPHLDIMLGARYSSTHTLKSASREGLTSTGLPVGLVDYILALKGGATAGTGPGSSAAADVARKDHVIDGKQLLAEWYRSVTGAKEKTS
ncbi:hypothetical protein CHLRE_10g422718v5 [Chlamydomonas reinhardtii]|uniref:Uncharacterized protein n=1 Tax=Chlamydomonas reinhardtii TaxID=3055 RepID=A0A2K3D9B3_CHLRE|nr:uncharacterized protein CHLRE_10g422718v5 [Chlamydomonas reinhardtii]PNW77115.1 hypothetical protein CHLRE_10g422718v5 [Chlamydomonas reinhardtii]